MMARKTAVVIAVGGVLVAAGSAGAYSAGITGQSAAGCTCHSPAPSADTAVTTALTPAGAGYDIAVDIQSAVPIGGIHQGGFDLSVTGGLLSKTPPADATVQIYPGSAEAGHTFAGSNQRRWALHWDPPSSTRLCRYDVVAAGNAVNGNGTNDPGDHWNLASASISVSGVGDKTPPSVPVFSRPAPGNVYLADNTVGYPIALPIVIGDLTIAVAANDDVGVAYVELFDAAPPVVAQTSLGKASYDAATDRWKRTWSAASAAPGLHTLTAHVVDCAGNARDGSVQAFVL